MDLDLWVCLRSVYEENSELFQNYECISLFIRQSFSFQNNPKNPDPSYKMDLYLWDC